jgi:phosphate transport system protein
MFKNLLQFWKGKDFLSEVLEEFKNMLDDSQIMFNDVCATLLDNVEQPNLKDKIYAVDRKVNQMQRDIRKRVIEHLTIQPSVDVSTCLVLMSVVKDAERLGDYAKNLYEIIGLLEHPIDKEKYLRLFNGLEKEISQLFGDTKKAFVDSDEVKAADTWKFQKEIKVRCDDIVKRVATGDLTVNEAVCFALIARFFKRLASHLTNIATSVILPISDLDYYDEKRQQE